VGAENIEIKVVMHSGGVQLLARALENEDIRSRVDSLKTQGVQFQVCANTLRGKGIDREKDLYEVAESDIVPSGVAHLAHLQGQGYTYIKP
jgi:intracellular sulfur oxidation DsrE/DsrF family protein